MTPSGIEPAYLRLVAQCLNRVPGVRPQMVSPCMAETVSSFMDSELTSQLPMERNSSSKANTGLTKEEISLLL
jgi:hypothetical protein